MKYNTIFWLEDHPEILSGISRVEDIDLDSLLDRTTFAHDFVTGREIVSHQAFDLYILDGDFPDKAGKYHLDAAQKYLRGLRQGECHHVPDITIDTSCNFIRLYLEHLSKDNTVVLFSASMAAMVCGYHLGIPSYAKGSISESSLKEYVKFLLNDKEASQRLARKLPPEVARKDESSLSQWECGGVSELLERYLKAQ